ncbi:MAG: hypothetical protein H3C43_13265, partial [Leptonema sp. (in: Bacteria)]|nr:hypothetical protein [Leptonema sp. (in: bacteria)]
MIWNRIKSAKAFSRMLGIFSILLLPAVVFSADRAKNIPGIDPLPLATGSGDISQTQSNLNQDNSLRQTSVDLGFPK